MRGRGRPFHVDGPKTDKAQEPTVESLVRGIWRLKCTHLTFVYSVSAASAIVVFLGGGFFFAVLFFGFVVLNLAFKSKCSFLLCAAVSLVADHCAISV